MLSFRVGESFEEFLNGNRTIWTFGLLLETLGFKKVLTGVVDCFFNLPFFGFFFDFFLEFGLVCSSKGYTGGDNVLGEYLVPYNIKHHSCKEDRPKAH